MLPKDFPYRFFNPLTSKYREDYIHILLSIESVLEQSKRIALPRSALTLELRRIFQREHYSLDVSDEESFDEELSDDMEQGYFAFTLRYLLLSGWIDLDESGDYASDLIFITMYGKKLTGFLKDLSRTEDQSGHVVNTYSNLQQIRTMPDNGYVCLLNAYESTQRLLTHFEMMYSKIKKYYAAVLQNTNPEELLAGHLYGYLRDVVDKLIFPVKVDDSVDRFKGPILNAVLEIQSDTVLIERIVSAAFQTKRVSSKEDGLDKVLKMINFIHHHFDAVESYIQQMDEKNQAYIRTTRQKLTYMLSMDTSIKGDIVTLLRGAKDLPEEEWQILSGCINLSDIRQITEESFYRPRKRHVRNTGEELWIAKNGNVLREDADTVINTRAAQFTELKVNEHAQRVLEGQDVALAKDMPVEKDDDYLMAIFLALNSTAAGCSYSFESLGENLNRGRYKVPEFILRRKGGRMP